MNTSSGRSIPRFRRGQLLTESRLNAVRNAANYLLDIDGTVERPLPDIAAILNGTLNPAPDALNPTSVEATICVWDPELKNYEQTTRTETVYNHSEGTTHEEDTFGFARFTDGHWVFFGDCEPMADRPAPPGGAS